MKVRVTQLGYYQHKRRYPGEVFELKDENLFSWLWMEAVGWEPKKPKPPNYKPPVVMEEVEEEEEPESFSQMQSGKKSRKIPEPVASVSNSGDRTVI